MNEEINTNINNDSLAGGQFLDLEDDSDSKEQENQVQSFGSGADDNSSKSELEIRAEELGVKPLSKLPNKIKAEALGVVSEEIARKNRIGIFDKDRETSILHVAMIDPQDIDALNILRFIAQKDRLNVEVYLTTEEILEEIFAHYGSAGGAVENVVQSLYEEEVSREESSSARDIQATVQDTPVAKLVQVIIDHALEGRASDIHIEPIDKTYRVRFRQDGILHSSLSFPLEVGKAVISRIKILSKLKIDEKRKPQDGRFRIEDNGSQVDFRVSSLPVVEGEKVVLRVLEKDRQSFNLKGLGLMGSQYDIFMERIKDPYAMILMTGPTGSGKSTTLYALIKILNEEERNIITLEDPVEYFIPGINQSQIKPEIGYTFASGLRSILRQDPNVIMVGEIRDGETAELAIHAALTGHLVFSTVHTNSAVGAIPRLIDMDIEPFLIASATRVIAAQRLVRKICPNCKEEVQIADKFVNKIKEELKNISTEEMAKYGVDISQGLKFHRGRGCEECNGLGLKGRLALYEVIELDEEMQNIIIENEGNVIELDKVARRKGYITLKQDGIMKVLLGMTTLAELERVTESGDFVGGKIDEVADEEYETK
ncbi:MAG: type II/IV secretion system protein [Candidatus Moranbacteria bacterium]|nr:type II/IV secretion system protein [Candidatus Moranbacteria bacterium]